MHGPMASGIKVSALGCVAGMVRFPIIHNTWRVVVSLWIGRFPSARARNVRSEQRASVGECPLHSGACKRNPLHACSMCTCEGSFRIRPVNVTFTAFCVLEFRTARSYRGCYGAEKGPLQPTSSNFNRFSWDDSNSCLLKPLHGSTVTTDTCRSHIYRSHPNSQVCRTYSAPPDVSCLRQRQLYVQNIRLWGHVDTRHGCAKMMVHGYNMLYFVHSKVALCHVDSPSALIIFLTLKAGGLPVFWSWVRTSQPKRFWFASLLWTKTRDKMVDHDHAQQWQKPTHAWRLGITPPPHESCANSPNCWQWSHMLLMMASI